MHLHSQVQAIGKHVCSLLLASPFNISMFKVDVNDGLNTCHDVMLIVNNANTHVMPILFCMKHVSPCQLCVLSADSIRPNTLHATVHAL